MNGRIFSIEEFALQDGPGIRTTVFLKGCPLRCAWCHNPEGQASAPELMVSLALCSNCGHCRGACPSSPGKCQSCGTCVPACPRRLRRIAGELIEPDTLAARILKNEDLLKANGGGVTLSGGEPLSQPAFVCALMDALGGRLHAVLETCGFSDPDVFRRTAGKFDLVLFDLKLADPEQHRLWTGADLHPILSNLEWLKSRRPFRARIPLIPGVTDTPGNLAGLATLLTNAPALDRVELLPFNCAFGAKHQMLPNAEKPYEFQLNRKAQAPMEPFLRRGLACIMA